VALGRAGASDSVEARARKLCACACCESCGMYLDMVHPGFARVWVCDSTEVGSHFIFNLNKKIGQALHAIKDLRNLEIRIGATSVRISKANLSPPAAETGAGAPEFDPSAPLAVPVVAF
jgi:hypothetical protein